MKKIHKYVLEDYEKFLTDPIEKWLDVQEQNGRIVVWAIVNTELEEQEYYLYCLGTGWPCKRIPGEYIGTVKDPLEEALIWHVFAAQVHRPENVDIGWADPEGVGFYVS